MPDVETQLSRFRRGAPSFPPTFHLKDLASITAPVSALKRHPHVETADKAARAWFKSVGLYDDNEELERYLSIGRFDLFAELAFPNVDQEHLETCLKFFLWGFSNDDISDEGEFQRSPQDVKAGHDISMRILYDEDVERPTYPIAAMLFDVLQGIRATANRGAYDRFCRAFKASSAALIQQSARRRDGLFPSISDFIVSRRDTIGAGGVSAMIEYAFDLDIPSYVFENEVVKSMFDAAADIMTWPNDLISFNKEQADDDYQNLVCIIMIERNIALQPAIDILTDMLTARVNEYAELKRRLPSFGEEVDRQLAVYHENLECFVQGTVVWYYNSPRYFPPSGIAVPEDMVVEVGTKTHE